MKIVLGFFGALFAANYSVCLHLVTISCMRPIIMALSYTVDWLLESDPFFACVLEF